MSKVLENNCLIFSTGGLVLVNISILLNGVNFPWDLLSLPGMLIGILISFFGMILGIIAFIKKPQNKWKSIVAIFLFILAATLIYNWWYGIINEHIITKCSATLSNSSKLC